MTVHTTAITGVVLALTAGTSMAAITTYSDQAGFFAAAGESVQKEGYESYGSTVSTGAKGHLFDLFQIQYSGISEFGVSNEDLPQYGVRALAGDYFLRANFGGGEAVSITFVLNEATTVFGTMINDVELAGLSFSTNTGETGVAAIAAGNDVVQYFGIISDVAFTQVTFTMNLNRASIDGVFFDETVVGGASVPAPAGMAILGLAGVAGLRRRR